MNTYKGRFFPMVYYQSDRDLRLDSRAFETQIHKIRDGLALTVIASTLCEEGWSYGATILNYPAAERPKNQNRIAPTEADITPSDILLQVTRPPLDEGTARRPLRVSGNGIEQQAFRAFRRVLADCDRSCVILSDLVRARLSEKDERYYHIKFEEYQGARIHYLHSKQAPEDERLTMGYLVSVPHAGPNSCRVLAAFGMGGTETLTFAHLLRTHPRWRGLLRQALNDTCTRLILTAFRVSVSLPDPYLDFCSEDLQPKVVVDVTIPCQDGTNTG